MIRLEEKKCNIILTEKQQKYQHYHLEKLINLNILQVKKYCVLIKIIETAKFTYSPLGKAFKKQTKPIEEKYKKQIKALDEDGKQLIKSSGEKDSLENLKQKNIFLMSLLMK